MSFSSVKSTAARKERDPHSRPSTRDSGSTAGFFAIPEVAVLESHDPRWEYIDATAKTSIYHHRVWAQFLESVYGHKAQFIVALDGKTLIDSLPIFLVRHPLLPIRKLVSQPYEACHGGFLSQDFVLHLALIHKARALASRFRANYLEIRNRDPIPELHGLGFDEKQPFVISELPLTDEQTNWNLLSKRHKRKIKAARNRGVTIRPATSLEDMRSFYSILSSHYHQIGMPIGSRKSFEEMWTRILVRGFGRLLLAEYDCEIVGGLLILFNGQELIFKYGAYKKSKKYKNIFASFLLFWEGILYGLSSDFRSISMGITDPENKGLLDFKNRFGSQTRPLHFYVYNFHGKAPEYATYKRYAFLQTVWKHTPNSMIRPLGHQVSRWLC